MPTYTKKEFLEEARNRLTTGRASKQYLKENSPAFSEDSTLEDVANLLKEINNQVQSNTTIFKRTDHQVIEFGLMIDKLSKVKDDDDLEYNDKNLDFLEAAIKKLKNIKVKPAPTKKRKTDKKEDLKLNVTVLTQQLRELAAQYEPNISLNDKCNRWANLIDPNTNFEPVHKMHEHDGLTVKGIDVAEVKLSMLELNVIIKGLAIAYLDKGLVKTHDEYYQMLSEVLEFNTKYINQVLKYRLDFANQASRVAELNPDLGLAMTNYSVASGMVDVAVLARVQAIRAGGGDALGTSSASAIDSDSSMHALTDSDFKGQISSLIEAGSLPSGEIERITRVLEAEGFGRHWRDTLDMIQEVMAKRIIIPQPVLNKMQANASLINGLREVARELVNESQASLTSNQLALALSGDAGALTVIENQAQIGNQSEVVFILRICNLLGADDPVEPNQLERLVTIIDSNILVLVEVAGLGGINRLSELSGRNILELCSVRTRRILQDVDRMPGISDAEKLAIQELASSPDIKQVTVPQVLIDMVNRTQSSDSSKNPGLINALRVLIVISGQQDRIAGNARRAAINGADPVAPSAPVEAPVAPADPVEKESKQGFLAKVFSFFKGVGRAIVSAFKKFVSYIKGMLKLEVPTAKSEAQQASSVAQETRASDSRNEVNGALGPIKGTVSNEGRNIRKNHER